MAEFSGSHGSRDLYGKRFRTNDDSEGSGAGSTEDEDSGLGASREYNSRCGLNKRQRSDNHCDGMVFSSAEGSGYVARSKFAAEATAQAAQSGPYTRSRARAAAGGCTDGGFIGDCSSVVSASIPTSSRPPQNAHGRVHVRGPYDNNDIPVSEAVSNPFTFFTPACFPLFGACSQY